MTMAISHSSEVWDYIRVALEKHSRDDLISIIGAYKWNIVYTKNLERDIEDTIALHIADNARYLAKSNVELHNYDSLIDEVIKLIEKTNTTDNTGSIFYTTAEGVGIDISEITEEDVEEWRELNRY